MLAQTKRGNWQGVNTKITTISEHVNSVETPLCLDVTNKIHFSEQISLNMSPMSRSLSQMSLKSNFDEGDVQ